MVYQPQIQYPYDQFFEEKEQPSPLKKAILVASIAAGVQYGWALQLSLLTPYVQLLGVPHKWAAFIWLCGPVSGLLVQPTVGYYSDRCTSRFGRRRPFIVTGAMLIVAAVVLIGFAADIGKVLGDSLEKGKKPASVTIFVLGFWLLDIGNNTLQGPCRAFLADISGNDEAMLRISNAIFAFFMAIGNLIGYGLGSYSNLYKFFPFTKTEACDEHCANLKACFLFSVFILTTITTFAVTLVGEKPLMAPTGRENVAIVIIGDGDDERVVATGFFEQIVLALKSLSKPMWILLFLTSLNWVGWFPFLLYDTDWMGKEVYGGSVEGTAEEIELYYEGVSTGALGLVWYVLTLGITSLAIEPLVQVLGGVKQVWSLGNFLLAVGMVMTVVITSMADQARNVAAVAGNGGSLVLPPSEVRWASLCLFALLGIPQAVTYSLPFALTSIISNSVGAGQGLALGVLNLSIVIPQVWNQEVFGNDDHQLKQAEEVLHGFDLESEKRELSESENASRCEAKGLVWKLRKWKDSLWENVETVNHILLHCPLVWRMWSKLLGWWNLSWIIPVSIEDLLEWWLDFGELLKVVVAMVSGPLDALFGGGNLPAFVMGGVAAVASGVFTLTWLPT